jgi:hypothetical protein
MEVEGMDSDDNDNGDDEIDDWGDGEGDEENDDDDEDVGSDDEEIDDEIVEKFILTFHNGDYDAEFDDALSYDRSVTLSTLSTQASYSKPDNWKERNQIGLERVKEELQTCINAMSHDTSFNLKLIYRNYLDQDEEPIVWHEPILDKYWDRLDVEIDRKRQLGIVTNMTYIFRM